MRRQSALAVRQKSGVDAGSKRAVLLPAGITLPMIVCGGAIAALVSCHSFPTVRFISENPVTGLELRVTQVSGALHDHPAKVSEQAVRGALLSSGYFIDADIAAVIKPIVTELSRLEPEQRLWLSASSADYHVFVTGKELVIVRYMNGDEFNRVSYTLRDETAPVVLAPTPQSVAPQPTIPSSRVAEPPQQGPTRIWTFAVGISRYQRPEISLQYAHRDAVAIDALFESPAGGAVPDTRRTLLTDEAATRAAILSALTSVSKRVAPNDMLVLYLAMHGLPDDGGDLYFLAHDTDPGALVGTGLPQRDVEYALASSPVRRIVMLLDACHAGAAGLGRFTGKRGLYLAETNRLLARLAETKPGLAVLSASSASESSNESQQWGGGHGVFTFHLTEGLQGRADADRDGLITIRELYDYVYLRVSDDTAGQQHPELKGTFDNQMPVARVVPAPQ